MADTQAEPRLFIPALKPLYDAAVPLSWLIVRVAVGWNLFVHGYNKLIIGPTDAFLKALAVELERHPVVGPGLVHRVAAELQKTFGVVAHSETLLAPAQRARQVGR